MVDPAVDQPVAIEDEKQLAAEVELKDGKENAEAETSGNIVKSTSWWGVSNLTSLISSPHVLEERLNNVANQVAQVGSYWPYLFRLGRNGVWQCFEHTAPCSVPLGQTTMFFFTMRVPYF